MHAFEFYQPTAIVFGPGTEAQAGPKAAQLGARRVLVVYGGQSAKASGLLSRVLSSLDGAGLAHDTFGGIHPNPRLFQAREGVQKALDFGADLILAVGGGSVIDASKAIALGAANPEADLWDFWQRKRPVERILPIGVVLTISASGSETSDTAVLTHDETLVKRGLGSDLLRPKFAILDPELTYTLPPYQVSCGVVDIMMHTLDRYFTSVTGNLLTDEIAEGLLRTVITCGARAHKNSRDAQAMSELMWAGSLSHNDLTGLGAPKDFAPHQLGHELSARFDFAHGATLSAVWGSWAAYCWKTNPARFAQYGVRVWGLDPVGRTQEELAQEAIARTVDFFRSLDMPTSLVELGCGLQTEEELEERKKPLEEKGCEFVSYPKTTDIETLKEEAKDADAMIIANMPMPGEVISACEHLKFLDVAFTGVDHVGLDACREKKVAVSNASGYSNEAVAELVIGMTLSLMRNLPQVEKRVREGGTKDGLVGCEIKGKTVGIIGLGNIGTRSAELFHAFGANVLAQSRTKHADAPEYVEQVSQEELLRESDIVVLHCPLNDSTRGMIDAGKLAMMKKSAILINVARGPVVNAEDLANALNNDVIAGAGIDVFTSEPPLPADEPLLHAKNTLLTPHIAFASEQSMSLRAEIVFDNLSAWMEGKQKNIIL